jgi:hypothetical protein
MNIGLLVFVVFLAAIALGEYMACKFVASRPGPIHLLAWVMMFVFFPVGMFGVFQGWYIRDLREIEKAEGAHHAASLSATKRFAKSIDW